MSDLVDAFELKKGDFVVVTGNFNRFLLAQKRADKNYDLNVFIDKIISKIQNNATLMFQTFSWDFCEKGYFDVRQTKSKTGALGNTALKRDDFARTRHPIYSFAVWGRYKNELAKLDNISSFGADTPFAFMHKNHAKMIIVNLELNHSFTFVHYVEQNLDVKYRFEKEFKGIYVDENNVKSHRAYTMFVRKDGIFTQLENLEKIFIENKAMSIKHVLNNEIKIIDLSKAYELIENDINKNEARNLHFAV